MERNIRMWKTWPWTQILLGLIIILNLMNYIETMQLKEQLQTMDLSLLRISSNMNELSSDVESLSSDVESLSDRFDRWYYQWQVAHPWPIYKVWVTYPSLFSSEGWETSNLNPPSLPESALCEVEGAGFPDLGVVLRNNLDNCKP